MSDVLNPVDLENQIVDIKNRVHKGVKILSEKLEAFLDAETDYPREGLIAGQVVEHVRDPAGREIVSFDLQYPWGVETIDGVTRFDVLSSSLVEW